jgi:hypothetical protein
VLHFQLGVTGKKVACESVCVSHSPRGQIEYLMECFTTVSQKEIVNQGSLHHCEGSSVVGGL